MAKRWVAAVGDMAVGALQRVVIEGQPICLVHAPDGNVYAINDRCTHEESSLSDGELWGMEVECPVHLSRFNLRTGDVTGPPAVLPAQTYAVTIEDGAVYVEIPALPDTGRADRVRPADHRQEGS